MVMQAYFRMVMQFLRDEQGAVLAEYSLVLSLCSMVAFAGYFLIAGSISGVYSNDNAGYNQLYSTYQQDLP